MLKSLWRIVESLSEDEVRILKTVESLSNKYKHVPLKAIEKRSGTSPTRLVRALKRLVSLNLLELRLVPEPSYALTFRGLDVLALESLKSRGIVIALGERLGIGKEGTAFLAVAPNGERLVVKLHRGGLRGFRRIKVYRSYASEIPGDFIELAKASAEREFKALVALKRDGALVPDGIAWTAHAVVQEYIPGVALYKLKPDLVELDVNRLAETVIETMRIAYTKTGIVHGDLSVYNVLVVLETSEGYVIDWPQYVYKDDLRAEELLRRDVYYVIKYFRNKWGLDLDEEKVLKYVKGEIDGL